MLCALFEHLSSSIAEEIEGRENEPISFLAKAMGSIVNQITQALSEGMILHVVSQRCDFKVS